MHKDERYQKDLLACLNGSTRYSLPFDSEGVREKGSLLQALLLLQALQINNLFRCDVQGHSGRLGTVAGVIKTNTSFHFLSFLYRLTFQSLGRQHENRGEREMVIEKERDESQT